MLDLSILSNLKKNYGYIVNIKQNNSALTNSVYLITFKTKKIIIKIFSKTKKNLFNRVNEAKLYKELSKTNFTPNLIDYKLNKYFIFDFIESVKLDNIAEKLALSLGKIHNTKISFIEQKPQNINKLFTKYVNKISQNTFITKSEKQKFTDIINYISYAFKIKNNFPLNIAFCHNDLNLDNLLLDKNNNLWVLDFEYASYNDIYFDIACVKIFLSKEDFDIFIKIYEREQNIKINNQKLNVFLLITTALSCAWALNFNYIDIFNQYYLYANTHYNNILKHNEK
jgi:thiamine kinase-like enzyme